MEMKDVRFLRQFNVAPSVHAADEVLTSGKEGSQGGVLEERRDGRVLKYRNNLTPKNLWQGSVDLNQIKS